MAKVLVAYFSRNGEATYDGICQSLLECGNDVFRLNTDNHINFRHWATTCTLRNEGLIEQISAFSPDIVFNFSYALPIEILEILPNSAKICIIDGDTPLYFWHKEHLQKNWDKYYFLGMQSESKSLYQTILNIPMVEGSNYLYFPSATTVRSEFLKKTIDISFIGSPFILIQQPMNDLYTNTAVTIYDRISKNFTESIETTLDALRMADNKQNRKLILFVKMYYVMQQRIQHLSCLNDLNLKIFGLEDWKYVAVQDLGLRKCFDPRPAATIQENEDIYNTSLLAVNISHPQAIKGFSWRVMDIMASNACLLTENKLDWHDLFGQYLSQEVIDAVTFNDRYDMRQKAIRLLADNNLREQCVVELNNAVEKNGRWEHRFYKLEGLINTVSLVNKSENGQFTLPIEGAKKKNKILRYGYDYWKKCLMVSSLLLYAIIWGGSLMLGYKFMPLTKKMGLKISKTIHNIDFHND